MGIKHQGACLCGGIAIEVQGELAAIQICHCSQCRRAQGGPFATNIPVPRSALRLSGQLHLLRRYESSPGKVRVFCGNCGSPIYSERSSLPELIRLRAGLLHEPVQAQLAFHAHVASRCSWWPIDDDLPHHEGAAVAPST